MKKHFKYLKYIITFIILLLILKVIDFNFLEAIQYIYYPYYFFVIILIPILINPLISNNRWRIFLKIQNIDESFFTLLKINFVSVFLGFLLPSSIGYDAIRMYFIEKRNKDQMGSGGASIIVERIIGFYILSMFAVIGSAIGILHGLSPNIMYLAIIINIFIVLVVVLLKSKKLYMFISKILNKINVLKKALNYLDKLYLSVNSFPYNKQVFYSIPLIMLFQLSSVLCAFLLYKAFGVDINFFYHLAFLPIIQILTIIPVSISGFGIREGGFVYFYSLIGVDAGVSLLVSLMYYFVLVIIPVFVGLFIYLFDKSQFKLEKDKINS